MSLENDKRNALHSRFYGLVSSMALCYILFCSFLLLPLYPALLFLQFHLTVPIHAFFYSLDCIIKKCLHLLCASLRMRSSVSKLLHIVVLIVSQRLIKDFFLFEGGGCITLTHFRRVSNFCLKNLPDKIMPTMWSITFCAKTMTKRAKVICLLCNM